MGVDKLLVSQYSTLTTETQVNLESKMDFISNTIIDLILNDKERYTKWGLPSIDRSNKFIVKGLVKE